MQSEGGLTTFGLPRCVAILKKQTNGCAAAYACVYGNAGNEWGHALRISNAVASPDGRRGNGPIPERVTGAQSIALY